MLMDSVPYVASIQMNSLSQLIINGARIKDVINVKKLGVTITPTKLGSLRWKNSIKAVGRS